MKYLNQAKKYVSKPLMATGAVLFSPFAMAIDTTAVQAAITAAETDALSVGEMVIAAVAALVVITLVISIVRKL
jgi:hypothetical protein